MKSGFALYRLPYAEECTLISGNVCEVKSFMELGGQQGFVVAPFALSPTEPILVIQPTEVSHDVSLLPPIPQSPLSSDDLLSSKNSRSDYHIDFANFHAHLLNGDFQKLVLSRSMEMERKDDASPMDLFRKACEQYPRMMIALFYTPQSGLWLAATPEILLSGADGNWQTIALAGTMTYEDNLCWSDKNIQEQRYVATYITHQLEQFTDNFVEEGPYTARAGHLAHLRSDFRFTLNNNKVIGELLQALHPTPAVCGLPKQESFRFILQYEHHRRSYYSGFIGPVFMDGQTNIFVTLRCMQFFQHSYRLYAGGGLLKDSDEEQEWQETETKLDTMRNIIDYVQR